MNALGAGPVLWQLAWQLTFPKASAPAVTAAMRMTTPAPREEAKAAPLSANYYRLLDCFNRGESITSMLAARALFGADAQ